MKIAVYAIAKNESRHVERFMDSVTEADMVIVADTGSTDDTVALLRSRGATVHEISVVPFRFDVARNMVLDLVPEDVDYCYSLDLDEMPLPGWRQAVEAAWQPGVTRFNLGLARGFDEHGLPDVYASVGRIHARHAYRWHRAVHEDLRPTGDACEVYAQTAMLHLPDRSKPRDQYLPLLEITVAEGPDDARMAMWLGSEYLNRSRWREAIDEFERFLRIADHSWPAERAGACRRIAAAWQALAEPQRALESLRRACQEAPGEREPWFELARLCHAQGLWSEGWNAAIQALTITERPRHYLVSDEAWGPTAQWLADQCAAGMARAQIEDSRRAAAEAESSATKEKSRGHVKIAVYSIAKNEANHVDRFMSSAREADLVIVADTGSEDNTVELLRAAGAIVHEIDITPWRFDTARNAALDLVPDDVDLCFSLDLDEVIEPGWRAIVEDKWAPGVTRMGIDYTWGVNPDGTLPPPFRHYRLHARHGYRWRNIVHEKLEPIGDEVLVDTNVHVHHLPDTSKPRSQYLSLMEQATQEQPDDVQLMFWLAREYVNANRYTEGIETLERYLASPLATWPPERAEALRLLGEAWRMLGDDQRYMDMLRRAAQEAPGEREPWTWLAQACHDRGLWQEGLLAAEQALAIDTQPKHYLVRSESWGALPADIASVCAWNLGLRDRARNHVIAARALAPGDQRIAANASFMGVQDVRVTDIEPFEPDNDDNDDEELDDTSDPNAPYLVSVTLTGNAREVIKDALASVVDWVDACLVVDTGVTDDTLDVARSVAGEKYREIAWPWRNDFAAARNAALDAAADHGATWAVILDTDERIVLNMTREDLRRQLRRTRVGALMVNATTGTYGKERFFRLPRRGEFVGPTHEAFVSTGGRDDLEAPRFIEIPKTPEQYQHKFLRDREILERHTQEHPNDPRWHYYLGDTLHNLGEHSLAIESFARCHALPGWNDQAAWAAYRAAECSLILNNPDGAVEWCAKGLARHAGVAELAWLAGFASWQAGRPDQAAAWARMSIANGAFAGNGSQRVGFRNPMALYEGPYDVLRFALRALGDHEGADEAERMWQVAQGARQAAFGS